MSGDQNTPAADYISLRDKVFREIIAPDCENEVRDVVEWRHRWRKIANWAEGIGHVFLAISTIVVFSAGYFDQKYISYAAGCANVICIALLRFAAYANKESSERNEILNRFLKLLGIESMPDLTAEAEDGSNVEAGGTTQPADAALPAAAASAAASTTPPARSAKTKRKRVLPRDAPSAEPLSLLSNQEPVKTRAEAEGGEADGH